LGWLKSLVYDQYKIQVTWPSNYNVSKKIIQPHRNFSRPSTKYMFFIADVVVHLRLGLAISKIYTKDKKKTRVVEDYFFLFWGWSKLRDAKRKIKRKTENIYKRNTRLNLDYLFPGNGTRKRGLSTVNSCIKGLCTCKWTSPPS
jgi:hypothetical protein